MKSVFESLFKNKYAMYRTNTNTSFGNNHIVDRADTNSSFGNNSAIDRADTNTSFGNNQAIDKADTKTSFGNNHALDSIKSSSGYDDLNSSPEMEKAPNKYVVLMFDRGYDNIFTTAKPILDKYGFKASIFIACDYIENGKGMNWNQIRQLYT